MVALFVSALLLRGLGAEVEGHNHEVDILNVKLAPQGEDYHHHGQKDGYDGLYGEKFAKTFFHCLILLKQELNLML